MRIHFDEQLEQLHSSIIKMGEMCRQVINLATQALVSYSSDNEQKREELQLSVRQTVETDKEIDRMEREIETLCFKLLLHQQPVARDLRRISAALKMISDMERIGDQASDIAEIMQYLPEGKISHKIHIAEMSQKAVKMVGESVRSYVENDIDLARGVIDMDDELDDMFIQAKRSLVSEISSGISDGEECIDLLMIAKYLERIGDHATNIAEWAEYSVCGIHRNSEMKD